MVKLIGNFLLCGVPFLSFGQNDTLNFLKVGDAAPLFATVDFRKDSIFLDSLLARGKVVIVFYRGAWCPYCNRHMNQLQDSLQFILDKGASLLAISPEVEASMEKIVSKSNVTFHVLHDENYTIMLRYGVALKVDEATLLKYKLFGINLEKANGNKDSILPVPATFILNQNGTIDFIDFEMDYKRRLTVKEILLHL
jgi:peroxiredoxin